MLILVVVAVVAVFFFVVDANVAEAAGFSTAVAVVDNDADFTYC